MQKPPVYTEPENCQDCYKCVRECPVKAIMVAGNKASIIESRCIYCGHCTQVCPTGAKKVRDGLTRAKLTLGRNPGRVYLSLAPSWVSEFGDGRALVRALKGLGFAGVSETALGAELVTAATQEYVARNSAQKLFITSACPVVVEWVRKYAPDYTNNITPIVSPMLAHARLLREEFGSDIKVIFAGPCVGKKSESDRFNDLVDVAITFKDLQEWIVSGANEFTAQRHPEHASLGTTELSKSGRHAQDDAITEGFVPRKAAMGTLYPIEGGMLAGLQTPNVRHMAFSGLDVIRDLFEALEPEKLSRPVLLELLACRGGCVGGPARLKNVSLARKRNDVEQRVSGSEKSDVIARSPRNDNPGALTRDDNNLHLDITPDPQHIKCNYSEQEIAEALASLGKTLPSDELNCSSCGYDSCRDFAQAMLDGRGESNMCASYMRRIAHDKATVLLHKIPAGVVLVGADMRVLDMNRTFAEYLGEETELLYDAVPGMAGAEIEKLTRLAAHFKTALATGEELRERRVTIEGKTWLLSIYNIQQHRQVFGLLQDIDEPTVRQEWMLEQMREVIQRHTATVQNVAGLLGENAAFTDATMRSIIEVMGGGAAEKSVIKR